MQIAILGAGMVGSAMAIDLQKQHAVTSFDYSVDALTRLQAKNNNIKIQQANLQEYHLYPTLLEKFDYVICAVPGFMGYKSLEAIINAGKNVVDISFFPEDGLALHELAIQKNVTAIIDCGVAPGMGNYILGYHNAQMSITNFECYVGGLPIQRKKPFEYKAPFSPIDVLEEYTRPARYVENSHIVTKPALSDAELIHFEPVGTLESFNTDGLRSILHTMKHIPNMKEKTLRYPGHIDLMKALISAGFLSTEKITVGETDIAPLDFTSKILFDQWKLGADEDEFTIMKIKIGNEQQLITYDLYDRYDAATNTSSMSRTTGYTATGSLQMMIEGLFTEKGVFPPENVGKHKVCFDFVLAYLASRGVHYKKTITNY